MTPTPPDKDELDEILLGLDLGDASEGLRVLLEKESMNSKNFQRAKQAISRLIAQAEARGRAETAKAYGGCTKCYGKGYATVNEYASGHATDGDIGGLEGRFKWKLDNIKPCSCDRGKQVKALQSKEGEM